MIRYVLRATAHGIQRPCSSYGRALIATIHHAATIGFSANNAVRYDRARPSYSAEALSKVVDVLKTCRQSSDPLQLCEIGAGTGKFTKAFIDYMKHEEATHADLLAVEPSAFLSHLESLQLPGVRAMYGTGEAIPAESLSFHGVLVAQAFHWMANMQCLKEVHRVLLPGGALVLIWNGFDSQVNWVREFEQQIILPHYPSNVPRFQSGEWKHVLLSPGALDLFSPMQTWHSDHVVVGDINMLIDRALSTSVISSKPASVHEEVAAQVRSLLSTHPDTRETTTFRLAYKTHVVSMRKM